MKYILFNRKTFTRDTYDEESIKKVFDHWTICQIDNAIRAHGAFLDEYYHIIEDKNVAVAA